MQIPAVPENGKFRILVVEDDVHIARLVMANLIKAGFECNFAQDGLAGLEAFKHGDFHLVLTDIMMPGMNGADLCGKIREISTVPIIMMTAADTDDHQLQGFKQGADDYVPKPFNPRMMVARVIAHLRRVYRYDFVAKQDEEAKIPAGWAKCEACGYQAQLERFRFSDAHGPSKICPLCGDRDHIIHSVA